MKQFYFISGLPRSGTTLLSAILNQNPNFYASISGPLTKFTKTIVEQPSDQGGYRFQCDENKRKNIIHGIFNNYYDNENKEIFFDTNLGWTLLLPLIKDLYPNTKMILCVRDIEWILDSFEQLIRNNPYSTTYLFNQEENTNVYTRCRTLLREDRALGFAYTGVKQAITSKERNMIYILEYEKLCRFPKQTLNEIYEFIGQPYFEHDFNNIELYSTRKKLEFIPRQMIIPPDIRESVKGMEVWR